MENKPFYDQQLGDFFQRVLHERQDCETQFAILNLSNIVARIEKWNIQLPRVKPHYAVKCNDDSAIIALMAKCGVNFDCASKNEIISALKFVENNRIVYANPCKQNSHLRYAKDVGVSRTMFDNKNELIKIKQIYPEAELFLRFCPPKTDRVMLPLGLKYGCCFDHVDDILQFASELDLNVIGVSFHVGSGCWDLDAFPMAIEMAYKVVQKAKNVGFNIKCLDIGGGYPGTDDKVTFEDICISLRKSLDLYFPPECGIYIIAEPGRYMVTTCLTSFSTVIGKRSLYKAPEGQDGIKEKNFDETHIMYYLNEGVYGMFNAVLSENLIPTFYPCDIINGVPNKKTVRSSIWGPTCDSLDCMNKSCQMPEVDINDKVMCPYMGAYSTSIACTFNGMERSDMIYCIRDMTTGYFFNFGDSTNWPQRKMY